MNIQRTDTGVVFIDPQNDVLSEKGSSWGAVGASVTENHTVENMERIFKAAKANEYEVASMSAALNCLRGMMFGRLPT
jgi:nicotinamidase-related amidase